MTDDNERPVVVVGTVGHCRAPRYVASLLERLDEAGFDCRQGPVDIPIHAPQVDAAEIIEAHPPTNPHRPRYKLKGRNRRRY